MLLPLYSPQPLETKRDKILLAGLLGETKRVHMQCIASKALAVLMYRSLLLASLICAILVPLAPTPDLRGSQKEGWNEVATFSIVFG